jgi:L-lactate dehydrogenase (cytochrome)
MRLLGVNSLEELEPGHVTQLTRLSRIAAEAPAPASVVI